MVLAFKCPCRAPISAIAEYYSIPLGEYDVAEYAVEIERNICNLPGGKQDQFAAAFGGFNFIEFLPDGRTIVNPLRLNQKTQNMLELSTVLLCWQTKNGRTSY